jgi:hypothetical protein
MGAIMGRTRMTEEQRAERDLAKRLEILKAAVKRSSGAFVRSNEKEDGSMQETFRYVTDMFDMEEFLPRRQVFFE